MATAQTVINQKGPLPITAAFEALSDAQALIMLSGSVWSNTSNESIGIQIAVDGTVIGTASIFANPATTHMSVVPIVIPYTFGFSGHKVTLSAATGNTVGDQNDYYMVTILY